MLRTDLEDERQINHHGKVRTVTGSGNPDKEEPDTHSTPVQSISQVKMFCLSHCIRKHYTISF